MRRGLRVALAGTVAAGAVLLGAGTAYAGNDSYAGGDDSDDGHSVSHKNRDGCDYRVEKDAPLKESDFPSDNHFEAYKNVTKKDSLDAHGKPYFLHNKVCQTHNPWRSKHYWEDHYGDKSYDSFKYKFDKKTGHPSRDPKKNTYVSDGAYDKGKSLDKDRKDLDRKHIGSPLNPKTQRQ